VQNSRELELFTKFMRAHNSLTRFLDQKSFQDKRLRGSGFPILELLYHKGPQSQCEIARKILKTTGNISQALDKLEKEGLVIRQSGEDRRTHSIELTPEGRRLALGILDPQEQELMAGICRKLGLSLEERTK